MRLMDILNVPPVSVRGDFLNEARKREIKTVKDKIDKSLKHKLEKSEILAAKLKARKGNITWIDDVLPIRNAIITAFMDNDTAKVIKMMEDPTDGYKAVEILKSLAIAHGGYDKLETLAGKSGKKDFIKTIFAYIDDVELVTSKETEDR